MSSPLLGDSAHPPSEAAALEPTPGSGIGVGGTGQAVTVLVIGRIVIVGGVASGGIVGTTWVSYQALCASSESQSSVTR